MKRYACFITALLCALLITSNSFTQSSWQPKNLRLATRWTKNVSPQNALREYPRPQLVRNEWTNLNGLWNYAITDTSVKALPTQTDGEILVPFPVESSLSGVQKMLKPSQYLWYKRSVQLSRPKGKKIILHFGAVDNETTVFINGKNVGSHKGGYTEFSFDITSAIKDGINDLTVKVYDPTDQGVYPHGKQVSNPANIYYTPTSGIWQTVWLETVPDVYIKNINITPDIDEKNVNVNVDAPQGYSIRLTALRNGNVESNSKGKANANITLPIYNPKLWSPDDPVLYDLKVQLVRNDRVVDQVTSYFAMRKVSIGKDDKGFARIFLNNKPLFNLGTLDQGFWPDGLYTAPTDNALKFDIEAIKAMGFNTIRKHIKVEPARWYYHCDKLGMLVWQDFVNPNQGLPEGAKPAFEQQLKETMAQLYNHPCITTWVLFNERWGAFDQQRLTEMVKRSDPTRLVNGHSGELLWVNDRLRAPAGNPWVSSDIADIHVYPDPANVTDKDAKGKVKVLGEFGGIGVFVPDHQWLSNKSWGYVQVTPAQLLGKYAIMQQHLRMLQNEGLAASIYTQPYDVEGEENGLMTYDREVIKIPIDSLRKLHSEIVAMNNLPRIEISNMDLADPGLKYAHALNEYINGDRDANFLKKLAMMAAQAGDKAGANRISNDYLATFSNKTLNDDDISMISEMTTSTKDAGYKLIAQHEEDFRKVLGDRPFTVKMMNLVYTGEMKDILENSTTPDWSELEQRVKQFGEPGNEILLRAKTVHYYNAQDWTNYAPVANEYLEKYGANLNEEERKMFKDAITNTGSQAK